MADHGGVPDEGLSLRAQAGDRDAERVLVDRYWEKAAIVANEFPVPGVERDDRHMVAVGALLRAVRTWRPGRGTKFLSYAKLLMKRDLIDLYRERCSARQVPPGCLLSLDAGPPGGDGDDLSLADVVASEEDLAREAELRDEAERAIAAAGAVARAAVETAAAEPGWASDASAQVLAAVRAFAWDRLAQGALTADQYGELMEVLDAVPGQYRLFEPSPRSGGRPAQLARAIVREYVALQTLVLMDHAAGCTAAEIAERRGVTPDLAGAVLAWVRDATDRGVA